MTIDDIDDLQVELRDYKAAVKYMHFIHTQQMRTYHRHLKRDHKDRRHLALWSECPASPCVDERKELALVQEVIDGYKQPGDPRGAPDGAKLLSAPSLAANKRLGGLNAGA